VRTGEKKEVFVVFGTEVGVKRLCFEETDPVT
jgi:hypothetical protein